MEEVALAPLVIDDPFLNSGTKTRRRSKGYKSLSSTNIRKSQNMHTSLHTSKTLGKTV